MNKAAVDVMVERNRRFAAAGFTPLPPIPSSRTVIISCADSRVDPAHILDVGLGEAAILRNLGGRITPAALQTLAMLAVVASVEGASDGWEFVLLQHTDCGITRLAGSQLVADYLGIAASDGAMELVRDPYAAVREDVAALAANPLLPDSLVVSGLVYDVATGGVSTVVASEPLQSSRRAASSPNEAVRHADQ